MAHFKRTYNPGQAPNSSCKFNASFVNVMNLTLCLQCVGVTNWKTPWLKVSPRESPLFCFVLFFNQDLACEMMVDFSFCVAFTPISTTKAIPIDLVPRVTCSPLPWVGGMDASFQAFKTPTFSFIFGSWNSVSFQFQMIKIMYKILQHQGRSYFKMKNQNISFWKCQNKMFLRHNGNLLASSSSFFCQRWNSREMSIISWSWFTELQILTIYSAKFSPNKP